MISTQNESERSQKNSRALHLPVRVMRVDTSRDKVKKVNAFRFSIHFTHSDWVCVARRLII